MLTQRISALAHDLARTCHIGGSADSTSTSGGVGIGGTTDMDEKTPLSSNKTSKETSHRYSIVRRRK